MRFDRRITLTLALLAPISASARTVHQVGPSGDFASIQAAIDASVSGDRIVVEAGTYSECLTLPAGALEIVGTGSASTTLDCGATATRALTGADAQLRLTGFTIANGSEFGISLTTGLFVGTDLVFTALGANTSGTLGGGLYLDATDAQLLDVTFTGCAAASGGALAQVNGGELIITNGIFTGNAAEDGGAVYLNRSRFAMHTGRFTSNTATRDGGAVFAESDTWIDVDPTGESAALVYVESVQLADNTAGARGGHVAGVGEGHYVVGAINSTFEGGTAGTFGGAIYSDGQGMDLQTTSFAGNTAASGGAIYGATSNLSMYRVDLMSNVALTGSGGAVNWVGEVAELRGTLPSIVWRGGTATGNTAANGNGGALRAEAGVSIEGATFDQNSAIDGGAVWYQGRDDHQAGGSVTDSDFAENVASGDGGAVFVMGTATLTLADSTFTANQGLIGGAVRISAPTSAVGNSVVRRATWSGNSAVQGGALAVAGRVFPVNDSSFDGNVASEDGGAIVAEGASITLLRTLFNENTAIGDGGGVFAGLDTEVAADASTFSGNVATSGGAVATETSDFDATQSWFCENRATEQGSVLSAREMHAFHTLSGSGFVGNSGGGSVLYADGVDATDTGAALAVNVSSFAENIASSGAVVLNATPAAGSVADGSSFQNYFFGGAGGLVTLNSASSSWVSDSDLFQDYSPEVMPGTVDASSWVLDGMGALFPSWTTAAGCGGDLTPDAVYTMTPYATREGSADALFIDVDTDNYTAAEGDCNPSDGSIYPGAVEIDGDGVDQNCDGIDGRDQDGDGVEDAIDCSWADASIPGTEVWYDGGDSDCVGVSDWDQDLDRFEVFVPNDHEESTAPFLLRMPDCDDTDGTIFPGAPETWYDGIDSDCDAKNDYDQDMDGYVVLGSESEVGGSAIVPGDCDDLRGDVYPGAEDVWYDGVDSDCGGENDYDQDGDGFIALGHEGNEGSLQVGDCDDLSASTNPGATDTVGNGIDDDCDGRIDVDITTDTDRDGVPDLYEEQYGTDPLHPDSDGDGIYDGKEWHDSCGVYTFADDPPVDTDGDTVIDALDTDSDNDGLIDTVDGLEDIDGDCLENYRDTDNDGDGVSTADELEAGTDPDLADTDGDGLLDGEDPEPLVDGRIEDTDPTAPPVEDPDCGCSSTGSSALGLFLLPLVALRRRRGSVSV